jgi:hypothetical protein
VIRYRFDLESGDEFLQDEIGVEADDLTQASEQAAIVVEQMRSSGELSGVPDRWEIVIRGENGVALKRIPV